MKQVHLAMQTLGFKPKDLIFIFMLLSAILQLSNIQFVKADVGMCQHWVVNVHMLEQVAQLLGMSPEKLSQTLTNQTNYVHQVIYTILLNIEQTMMQ